MSRTITISLDNLNSLYFKFISQFVLQYLPKTIFNEVSNLLNLKSAIEVYRFLDKMVNMQEQKKDQAKKDNSMNPPSQSPQASIEKEDSKYQNELINIKKPPLQPKKAKLYQTLEDRIGQNTQSESFNFQVGGKKQDSEINNQGALNAKTLNNFSYGINQNYNGRNYLNNSNQRENKQTFELPKINENLPLREKKQSSAGKFQLLEKQSRQKDKKEGTIHVNSFKKIEFQKSYTSKDSNMASANVTGQSQSQQSALSVNRSRLQNLIKEAKQIFIKNSQRISRYEKISLDFTSKSLETTFQKSITNDKSLKYLIKKH